MVAIDHKWVVIAFDLGAYRPFEAITTAGLGPNNNYMAAITATFKELAVDTATTMARAKVMSMSKTIIQSTIPEATFPFPSI